MEQLMRKKNFAAGFVLCLVIILAGFGPTPVLAQTEKDLLKVAAVDRTIHPGMAYVGMLKGFGLKSGVV